MCSHDERAGGTRTPINAGNLVGSRASFAYTGSVLPVMLGAALAYDAGYGISWVRFVLTLAGIVCFQTTANLLNDCFDFQHGLDVDPNPASGAVVRGWLTDRQVRRGALVFLLVGCACGLVLTWLVGWVVLLLGVVGAALVLGYTRSGHCLKYAGLGNLVRAPLTVLAVFLSLPKALSLVRAQRSDGTAFLMLDARTAQCHMLFGLLLVAAFVVARLVPCCRCLP